MTRGQALLVVLALAVSGCRNPLDGGHETTVREMLEIEATTSDAPAIAVPRELPAGYGMVWPNMYWPDPDSRDELPIIEACVLPEGRDIIGTCVGTEDDSPWLDFEVDGHTVVVSTVSVPERREFLEDWADLDWTTDWRDVAWVDDAVG